MSRRTAAAYQNLVGRHTVKEGQMGLKSERYKGEKTRAGERMPIDAIYKAISVFFHFVLLFSS